ncbi:hypothetical protein [Vibrio sp. Isolate24]|uniref:hypothetical protein n=1 Tax=Vibrio sp. Isolate24 TaxID=2908534 RepID=UPI001EFEEE6F|nr:hypothetical protein [Vibrio sp. Isolate24]MCG9680464.1 hypothetical protein [Vibrio sp. Isolate24]
MKEMLSKLLVPILTGVMGLSGVLIGAHISADKAEELWQQQEREAKLKLIFMKRVELIERVSEVVNHAPKYTHYQSYVEVQKDLFFEYEKCKKEKQGDCVKPDSAKDITEMALKRADLNAEFASTVQLVALYFQCDAKTIAQEFQYMTEWWSPNKEPKFRALIAAMLEEVSSESFSSCSSTTP